MQNTGLTNCSFWSGLEKGINHEYDHYGAVKSHFAVHLAIFGMVTNKQPNNQVILEQARS